MNVTRQLLAFARKQHARARSVDLNALLAGTSRMLDRLVGEDIRIRTDLAPAPVWVCADPGQLDQVLVNLVVNARDAMPEGGWVTLTTAESPEAVDGSGDVPARRPGDFARLTGRDTGVGMAPELRSRIFEPGYVDRGVEGSAVAAFLEKPFTPQAPVEKVREILSA